MEDRTLTAHQAAMLKLLEEFDRICKKLDIPYFLYAGTLLGAVRHQGFIPWDDDLDVILLRRDYIRFLREAPALIDPEIFCLQGEFSEHWPMFFSKLRLQNTTCLERYHPRDPHQHQGIYLDIFPCDNAINGQFFRRIQFLASKIVIAQSLYRRGYDTKDPAKRLALQLCRLLPVKPFLRLSVLGREDSKTVHTFFSCGKAFRRNVFPRHWFTETENGVFQGLRCPIPAHWDDILRTLYGDYMTPPSRTEKLIKHHAVLVDTERSYEHYTHYRDDMEFDILTQSIR